MGARIRNAGRRAERASLTYRVITQHRVEYFGEGGVKLDAPVFFGVTYRNPALAPFFSGTRRERRAAERASRRAP